MTCKISDFGKRVTHECKAVFDPYMDANPHRSSSMSFVSLCVWGQQYYKVIDGFLCIVGSDWVGFEVPGVYMAPPLSLDGQYEPQKLRELILKIKKEVCPSERDTLSLLGVPEVQVPLFNEALAGLAQPTANPESWDYVYKRSDLEHLAGRKYTVKRNHINHLKGRWKYNYEPITPDCLDELAEVLDDFLTNKIEKGEAGKLIEMEVAAVKGMLSVYRELGLFGGFIRLEGKIKAFTMGSMLHPDMADVAVEKADPTVRGLYQAINREFAKSLPPEVLYINREEDMGVKGLRQAKKSYHPCCMLKVYGYRF